MVFPKMVRAAKTPVRVVLGSGEINEFGEHETLLDDYFMCNYQATYKEKYTKDKNIVTVTGLIFIDGDIMPEVLDLPLGKVYVDGNERDIAISMKCRNIDGSVNFTRLELI